MKLLCNGCMRWVMAVAVAVVLPGWQTGWAQPQPAQTLAAQEKQWQSCEGGYYTGPRQGRRNYSNDKYLWVATPEFAKRFCLPEHMVSKELKGAQAIAFRMVDGADSDRCGVDDDGKANCSENSKARFEIYLPQSLNLPAANPGVKFFEGGRTTSEWYLSNINERITKSTRYERGQYQILPGEMPRFRNPFSHPDPGHRFALIYAHEGKGRWPVAPLWEVGFRGDWIQGMDMLILEEQLGMGFSRYLNVEKAKSHGYADWLPVIAMDQRNDFREDKDKRLPDDYAHVIYLPKPFAEQVRQASMRRGGNWLDFIKTYQQR